MKGGKRKTAQLTTLACGTAHKLVFHFARCIFSIRCLIFGDFVIFQVNWTLRERRCVSQCVCCVLQPTRMSPGPASGRIPSSDIMNSTVDFSFFKFIFWNEFFQERPDFCLMRTTTWRTRRRRLSSGGKISGLARWNYFSLGKFVQNILKKYNILFY